MSHDRLPAKDGAQSAKSAQVPEALVDCHQRLRAVTTLATALGTRDDAQDEEVREVATKVHRYFTVALPLHEQDEDRSLFPRLLQHSPGLAPTIALLRADHQRQALVVAALVALCEQLLGPPGPAGPRAGALAAAAEAVSQSWKDHLAIEERELFPQAHQLSSAARAAIAEEMRERRAHLPA